jgi:hypothetical protein
MTVVLCLNVPELMSGGWRSHEVCKKYPGAGFLPYLQEYGDIYSGGEGFRCSPEEILVIQEEENPVGLALLEKGAKGGVLFCLESPLFAPLFYDNLPEIRSRFQRQFLFQGGTDPVFFPSFDADHLKKPEPWAGRRPRMCYITSNKHFKQYEHIIGWKESKSFQKAVQFQLHDSRYLTIHNLNKIGILDLFGKGWPEGMSAPPLPDGEKLETLRRYRFGIAIENTAMPGYITEKLIDCMVAGVVPIYKGAPDITQFVPEECFLKLEEFKWPDEKEAMAVIDAGQCFLRSAMGRRFSYQSFAHRILAALQGSVSGPRPHVNPAELSPSGP